MLLTPYESGSITGHRKQYHKSLHSRAFHRWRIKTWTSTVGEKPQPQQSLLQSMHAHTPGCISRASCRAVQCCPLLSSVNAFQEKKKIILPWPLIKSEWQQRKGKWLPRYGQGSFRKQQNILSAAKDSAWADSTCAEWRRANWQAEVWLLIVLWRWLENVDDLTALRTFIMVKYWDNLGSSCSRHGVHSSLWN